MRIVTALINTVDGLIAANFCCCCYHGELCLSALCNHLILLLLCCTFSMGHIERANEAMAVETLLVTDELFR